MLNIHNDFLSASVSTLGAELQSLRSARTGLEYLWDGDPRWWKGRAPILFPVVGKLERDRFRHGGEEYTLPQHGFARERAFEVLRAGPERVVLRLTSDPESLRAWPFPFTLTVSYALEGPALRQTFRVENPVEQELRFSLGLHPGFRCPLAPGERWEDYRVSFELPETLERHKLAGGLRTGKTEPFLDGGREFPLERGLFASGAVVLNGVRSRWVRLHNPATGNGVACSVLGFPWLGFWTKGDGAFLCIEPWHGVADRVDHDGSLDTKEGLRRLGPGEVFEGVFAVRPLEEAAGVQTGG
ncbi:MAG: aldose 1-epimerase family protein [Acidobacteria bacterium]|nr:aldose 1-epimerase family protein [Acidobacteriota bacterium]